MALKHGAPDAVVKMLLAKCELKYKYSFDKRMFLFLIPAVLGKSLSMAIAVNVASWLVRRDAEECC